MNKILSEKIFEKIKEEKIEPRSKWKFLIKNYFVWVIFGLSIVIGSLATSVVIFILRNNDWGLYPQVGGLVKFIFLTMPYFWIIILGFFVYIAYYEFRKTKGGYKYHPLAIVLISFFVSIIIGSFAYATGVGEKLERSLDRRSPIYQKMFYQKKEMWTKPEKGLIAGHVVLEKEGGFELRDIKGDIWDIVYDGSVKVNDKVWIVGDLIEDGVFEAKKIGPFLPNIPGNKNGGRKNPGMRSMR